MNLISILVNFAGKCKGCAKVKFRLANHKLQLTDAGTVESPQKLENDDDIKLSSPACIRSIECVFNPKFVANVLLEKVRTFNQHKGTNVKPKGLMDSEPQLLYGLVKEVCQNVTLILKNETKCHAVSSPCFVIGDIHGNLEDLLSLEKAIWPRIPCLGSSYLFLGDYVDRGRWSLEVVLYLLAFKCLCPLSVTLLRGNHEVRQLQMNYTYKTECLTKYGNEFGNKIWDVTNALFDKLPVSSVVDKTVWCSHGGIPRSISLVHEINLLPQELPDPQHQCPAIWEQLWYFFICLLLIVVVKRAFYAL